MVGWLVGWLAGWLVGWLVGRLAGWLVDWLAAEGFTRYVNLWSVYDEIISMKRFLLQATPCRVIWSWLGYNVAKRFGKTWSGMNLEGRNETERKTMAADYACKALSSNDACWSTLVKKKLLLALIEEIPRGPGCFISASAVSHHRRNNISDKLNISTRVLWLTTQTRM